MPHPTYDLSKEILRREEARVAKHRLVAQVKKRNPAKRVSVIHLVSQFLANLIK